jgi:hypothetical protein
MSRQPPRPRPLSRRNPNLSIPTHYLKNQRLSSPLPSLKPNPSRRQQLSPPVVRRSFYRKTLEKARTTPEPSQTSIWTKVGYGVLSLGAIAAAIYAYKTFSGPSGTSISSAPGISSAPSALISQNTPTFSNVTSARQAFLDYIKIPSDSKVAKNKITQIAPISRNTTAFSNVTSARQAFLDYVNNTTIPISRNNTADTANTSIPNITNIPIIPSIPSLANKDNVTEISKYIKYLVGGTAVAGVTGVGAYKYYKNRRRPVEVALTGVVVDPSVAQGQDTSGQQSTYDNNMSAGVSQVTDEVSPDSVVVAPAGSGDI